MTTGPGFTALLQDPAPQLSGKGGEKRENWNRRAEITAPDFISIIILAIANIYVGLIESRY